MMKTVIASSKLDLSLLDPSKAARKKPVEQEGPTKTEATIIDDQVRRIQRKRRIKESKQKNFRVLDDYAEYNFWERVLNTRTSDWTMAKQALDQLMQQWELHKNAADSIQGEWNQFQQEEGSVNSNNVCRARKVLDQAKTEQEMLSRIGSRLISVSLMNIESAKKAGIEEEQVDAEARRILKNMRNEKRALQITVDEVSNYIKQMDQLQQDEIQQLRAEQERLLAQKAAMQATVENLNSKLQDFDNHKNYWKTRAVEAEQDHDRLRANLRELEEQYDKLKQEHRDLKEENERLIEQERQQPNQGQERQPEQEQAEQPQQERQVHDQFLDEPLNDDEYFHRLVVEQEGEPMEQDRQDDEIVARQIRRVQRRLDQLERAKQVPMRVFVEFSRNMDPVMHCIFCGIVGHHFSDSCPHVIDVHRRRNIVDQQRRCWQCLERCYEREQCPYANKLCKYCIRASGTILERREERRHHTALCHIPEDRERIGEQIERAHDELHQLMEARRL
ncbi:unnamed protein product [Nippostrongylus brasiliensis]|uniref:CCHC-type domain-containing protein n=1 Tax=Nippostrongylus brasiliensis TaxID=27835 RepID=A0A0N4XPB5_NIPBR|nr:hypothetical protein Q1695_015415 [Nippostrongylus brasiliensis]VDL67958.1 unnamed protein product [Nippostrongylus brasiliensis]